MSGGFREQQSAPRFQGVGSLVEEWTRPRHFMHHGTGEHEVNRALNVVEAHRHWRNHSGADAIE
jgi:hypothetical protein